MADPEVRTAALLLNFRHPELTLLCLADLLAIDDAPMHVFVIDNGSGSRSGSGADDGAVAGLQRDVLAMPPGPHRVTFVALPTNLGFTGGMNHGIQLAVAAGLPFVLVLNNDLRLPKDFLRPLVEVLANDSGTAAVGPTVLRGDGRVWAEGGSVGCRPNLLRLLGQGGPPSPREHGPEAVPFLPGACVLFRTADLAALGGFDDAYFMYWEDVDLCERLRERGGRIVWLPWVRVTHTAGQSSGGGRSPLRKFLMANNAVRHLRARGTPKLWFGFVVFEVLLWPLALLSGPRAAIAKLQGTLAGLRGHRASAADVERFLVP